MLKFIKKLLLLLLLICVCVKTEKINGNKEIKKNEKEEIRKVFAHFRKLKQLELVRFFRKERFMRKVVKLVENNCESVDLVKNVINCGKFEFAFKDKERVRLIYKKLDMEGAHFSKVIRANVNFKENLSKKEKKKYYGYKKKIKKPKVHLKKELELKESEMVDYKFAGSVRCGKNLGMEIYFKDHHLTSKYCKSVCMNEERKKGKCECAFIKIKGTEKEAKEREDKVEFVDDSAEDEEFSFDKEIDLAEEEGRSFVKFSSCTKFEQICHMPIKSFSLSSKVEQKKPFCFEKEHFKYDEMSLSYFFKSRYYVERVNREESLEYLRDIIEENPLNPGEGVDGRTAVITDDEDFYPFYIMAFQLVYLLTIAELVKKQIAYQFLAAIFGGVINVGGCFMLDFSTFASCGVGLCYFLLVAGQIDTELFVDIGTMTIVSGLVWLPYLTDSNATFAGVALGLVLCLFVILSNLWKSKNPSRVISFVLAVYMFWLSLKFLLKYYSQIDNIFISRVAWLIQTVFDSFSHGVTLWESNFKFVNTILVEYWLKKNVVQRRSKVIGLSNFWTLMCWMPVAMVLSKMSTGTFKRRREFNKKKDEESVLQNFFLDCSSHIDCLFHMKELMSLRTQSAFYLSFCSVIVNCGVSMIILIHCWDFAIFCFSCYLVRDTKVTVLFPHILSGLTDEHLKQIKGMSYGIKGQNGLRAGCLVGGDKLRTVEHVGCENGKEYTLIDHEGKEIKVVLNGKRKLSGVTLPGKAQDGKDYVDHVVEFNLSKKLNNYTILEMNSLPEEGAMLIVNSRTNRQMNPTHHFEWNGNKIVSNVKTVGGFSGEGAHLLFNGILYQVGNHTGGGKDVSVVIAYQSKEATISPKLITLKNHAKKEVKKKIKETSGLDKKEKENNKRNVEKKNNLQKKADENRRRIDKMAADYQKLSKEYQNYKKTVRENTVSENLKVKKYTGPKNGSKGSMYVDWNNRRVEYGAEKITFEECLKKNNLNEEAIELVNAGRRDGVPNIIKYMVLDCKRKSYISKKSLKEALDFCAKEFVVEGSDTKLETHSDVLMLLRQAYVVEK